MSAGIDLAKFKNAVRLKDRYEEAVNEAIANLATAKTSSLGIYGEPQSGKTEMMICLTAKLLTVAHLKTYENAKEKHYTMLIHTSGKKQDHQADRAAIQ